MRGRGATFNPEGRFESRARRDFDDGWGTLDEELPPLETTVIAERAKTIITTNDSPDVGFEQSINPYRGCEHGCIYCYARPAHAYMNLSPGLDFETKLFYKADAARLLEQELRRPGYVPKAIHIGGNTDGYQPIERNLKVTRSVLEVLQRFGHPCTLITKSSMIERDLDILGAMARDRLVSAAVSVTSMDPELKRTLEPRTASPAARLRTIRRLANAGVPVTVMVAPVIPFVTDADLESILAAAAEAGATSAGYVFLRLPHEVKELFRAWLAEYHPLKAEHVMSLVQQASGGKDYDSRWGVRQRGQGEYAGLIAQRFHAACKRLGLNQGERARLDHRRFAVPPASGDQMGLGF
ncbi:MAG TPA: PA0069 family radical SAM protein [Solimonas sp.]|nr:PA0069 family radical SAM protein [Solimonas sp.]